MPNDEAGETKLGEQEAIGGYRTKVFISYSHKDAAVADLFQQQFDAHETSVEVFKDHKLAAGDDWDSRLRQELTQSRIALLLVSPDFVRSEYIRDRELPWILQQRRHGLIVNWVEVRPTPAPPRELQKIQAFKVQDHIRALSLLPDRHDEARISEIVGKIVENLSEERKPPHAAFHGRVSTAAHRRFGYTVLNEIASGSHSVVYRAVEPGRSVAIKAWVRGPLEEDEVGVIERAENYLKTARSLQNPAFIKLHDWDLDQDPQFLVTEYIRDSQSLKAILDKGPLDVKHVRFITQRLAAALHEYHEKGLVYDSLRPSDVLVVEQPNGDLHPRISAYRATKLARDWAKRVGKIYFTRERLNYMSPEECATGEIEPPSDQYALGLLAIEMLMGAPPVHVRFVVDLLRKKEFIDDPDKEQHAWFKRSPRLGRVVLKMIASDPADRYGSLDDVATALGGESSIARNSRRLAKGSRQRLLPHREEFFRAFYKRLFEMKPTLQRHFDEDHDWERQRHALAEAVHLLLNTSHEDVEIEPTMLTATAGRHKKMKLVAGDYDAFMKAFTDTLGCFDEGSDEMKAAWKSAFQPGLDYMRVHGSTEGKPPVKQTRAKKKRKAKSKTGAKKAKGNSRRSARKRGAARTRRPD